MKNVIQKLMDWCFAMTFLVAALFFAVIFTSLFHPSGLAVNVGTYRFRGPFYFCWPVMGVGLASVASCCFFLGLAFQEGRAFSRHEEEKRAIEAAQRENAKRRQRRD